MDIIWQNQSPFIDMVFLSLHNGRSCLRLNEDAIIDSSGLVPGLKVIKLEFILRLKIKRNDWLIADTCPQSANHCALF